MLKNILITACLTSCMFNSIAQSDDLKEKKFNNYAGVQANELLRQILSLGNNNTVINNPYLFTYAVHAAKSGWGLQTGIGFNYQKITDKDLPGDAASKTYDLFFRIGFGRKVMLSKRFEAGYALDFATNSHDKKTFSSVITNFGIFTDSTATISENKMTDMGGGIRFSLGFYINDKIMVGTETTGYLLKSKDKQSNVVFTLHSNNLVPGNTSSTETVTHETDTDSFSFALPVAIFLIVRF